MESYKPVCWVNLDKPHHMQMGRTRHTVRGEVMDMPIRLKIVSYRKSDEFYLIYLDKDDNELTDTWHESIEKAMRQAEFEFNVKREDWIFDETKNRINQYRIELNDLLNEWDPIGVSPFKGGPSDEYKCFIDPILSLFSKGTKKEEIVNFLKNHLSEDMGLEPRHYKTEGFADKLMNWWRSKPPA